MSEGVHSIEISKRPPKSWVQILHGILCFIVFNFGTLMVNASQLFILLPLRFLPFQSVNSLYNLGIRLNKGAFGTLLVLMCQWFAPSTLVITLERDGPGAFSQEEIDKIAIRDSDGRVLGLNLPRKSLLIANHQVYVDWWYTWCLTYFMDTHRDVCIVLKKSLKWVPVVGWGMQFFNFIFLARSWASDRLHLVKQLSILGRTAQKYDTPLTFIIWPEGYIASPKTRAVSKKYADKLGISDMTYTLLPRSTGLHHSLRALSSCVPDLQLLDITVAYPGVPSSKYARSYYTLRSVILDGVPPPVVHMHIRRFDVAKEVPIGDISQARAGNSGALPYASPHGQTIQVPENEQQVFDTWLRDRWIEKDQFIQHFHDTGSFSSSLKEHPEIDLPLQLRHKREILDSFCFFVPPIIAFIWAQILRLIQ